MKNNIHTQVFLSALTMSLVFLTNTVQADTAIYYVHNDHLGTPKMMTDENQNKVWEANHNPFGEATVNEDVDVDGEIITMNVRFPGQYYDSETNLHYNWNRYYDPSIGRYITSDPIGLYGGISTYGYVSQNPINAIDFFGLKEFLLYISSVQAGLGYFAGEFGIMVFVDPCTLDLCAFSFAGAGVGLGFGAAGSGEVGVIDLPSGQCNQLTGFGLGVSGFLARPGSGVAGSVVGSGPSDSGAFAGGTVGGASGGGFGISGQGTYTWPAGENTGNVPQWILDAISDLNPDCDDC